MSVVVCSLPPLLLTWALNMGDPFPPHLVWTPVMDLDGTRGQSSRFIAGSDPTEACPPPDLPPSVGRTMAPPSAKQPPPPPPALHLFLCAPLFFDCCFSKENGERHANGLPREWSVFIYRQSKHRNSLAGSPMCLAPTSFPSAVAQASLTLTAIYVGLRAVLIIRTLALGVTLAAALASVL